MKILTIGHNDLHTFTLFLLLIAECADKKKDVIIDISCYIAFSFCFVLFCFVTFQSSSRFNLLLPLICYRILQLKLLLSNENLDLEIDFNKLSVIEDHFRQSVCAVDHLMAFGERFKQDQIELYAIIDCFLIIIC